MRSAPFLDGFFDEWTDAPDALNDDRIRLKIGQFDDRLAFALEVRDLTRFYREPLFGRSEAVPFDAVRLRLTDRSSVTDVVMAAEASGAFDAVVSGQSIPLNIDTRVRAYWWEFFGGYRIEWEMPVSQIIGRQVDLIHLIITGLSRLRENIGQRRATESKIATTSKTAGGRYASNFGD